MSVYDEEILLDVSPAGGPTVQTPSESASAAMRALLPTHEAYREFEPHDAR